MSRLSLALAHRDEVPMAMGCSPCETLPLCGGLHTTAGVWSCDSYCTCVETERATCPYVCRNKPDEYARREREVNGFDLHTVPHAPVVGPPPLPNFVPLVFGRSRLVRPVPATAVAVRLADLFYAKTGLPRLSDGRALRQRFGVPTDARLVVSGVSRDRPIERYWDRARRADFRAWLATAAPDLVTVPNFSVFSDVPREDNFHAMKRIAVCWQELAEAGLPTALHLNGRTQKDWERWLAFLRAYPEVGAVAFEFATGPSYRARGPWHADRLAWLAKSLDRPLTLVVRGGFPRLRLLAGAFSRIVFLSATPYVKTMKRQRLVVRRASGQPWWRKCPTQPSGLLDDLFLTNTRGYTRLVTAQFDGRQPCVTGVRN